MRTYRSFNSFATSTLICECHEHAETSEQSPPSPFMGGERHPLLDRLEHVVQICTCQGRTLLVHPLFNEDNHPSSTNVKMSANKGQRVASLGRGRNLCAVVLVALEVGSAPSPSEAPSSRGSMTNVHHQIVKESHAFCVEFVVCTSL